MRNLTKMLERLTCSVVQGDCNKEINHLTYDSRKVEAGDLFVCISGTAVDGHDFIEDVVNKGATAIIIEKNPQEIPKIKDDVTIIRVENTRIALAMLSAAYFDYPADSLKVIGITGTKGKTTTTYMVKSILEEAGHKVGLIGTIGAIILDEVIPSTNTTPESYVIQEFFRKMLDKGCDMAVMEVSSQGLMMHRTDGFMFELGIFTNIEPDHIGPNEHKDFEEYMHCKGMLFKQCKLGIVNADDIHYKDVIEGHTCDLLTFGIDKCADLKAENVKLLKENGNLGISYDTKGIVTDHFEIDLPGRFSVYNSLTSIAICHALKVDSQVMKDALKNAKVRGRIEKIPHKGHFTLMIDYAHNSMALESLLSTLKDYGPKRLIALFGCGGNRSKLRRFEMGEVSGKLADFTIITSDNPRFEEPIDIIHDIETGIGKTDGKFISIIDRREAIEYAVKNAKEDDCIVICGKGHEDYQEIKGVKYPMDDRLMAIDALKEAGLI